MRRTTDTATAYTGSYNGTIAKRTASPLDRFKQAKSPRIPEVLHNFGQRALGVHQKAFAVECLEQVTTYLVMTETIAEQPSTATVTAETPTVYVTQPHREFAGTATAPALITSTATAPSLSNSAASCTVTSASSTTTQHLKCAPTNLLSEIAGYGIGQTGGDSANTRGLAQADDASACCQLCMEDEDCAASEADLDAGNCFL